MTSAEFKHEDATAAKDKRMQALVLVTKAVNRRSFTLHPTHEQGSLLIAPSRVPMPPLDRVHLGSSCAQAQARGRLPPLQSSPPSPVRTLVREFLRQQDLSRLRRRDTCKQRWLYYRGDENYGLGNVLYDVASAAAIAMVLNRSIVYGANASDRKFGSLLRWPGIPTLQDVEAARRWARCGSLSEQRHVMLEPDKCTFHKRWRMERTHLRCFRRLLGVDWLQDRA